MKKTFNYSLTAATLAFAATLLSFEAHAQVVPERTTVATVDCSLRGHNGSHNPPFTLRFIDTLNGAVYGSGEYIALPGENCDNEHRSFCSVLRYQKPNHSTFNGRPVIYPFQIDYKYDQLGVVTTGTYTCTEYGPL